MPERRCCEKRWFAIPGAAEVRLNLVANLLQEERAAEALALFESAPLPSDPRMAQHWQAQRVLALIQSGRPAEARDILEKIPGGRPGTEASSELAPAAAMAPNAASARGARRGESQGPGGPDGKPAKRRCNGDRARHHGPFRPRKILVKSGRP